MKTLLMLAAAVCTAAADPDVESLVERFYLGAKVTLAENAACLDADQQAWQHGLKACKEEACLKRAQMERLATLQALQESVPRGLELPDVPQLLWAISPPAGPRAGGIPLQIEGRLEYRAGYYLRDGNRAHLLVDDLSLRGASAQQLREIRNESRDARLMARGIAAAEGGFDPKACVFLYALP